MTRGIFRDLAGQEIGLWKVLQRGPTLRTSYGKRTMWVCLCVGCDTIKLVDAAQIGKQSSGCQPCRGNFNWQARDEAAELRDQGLTTAQIAKRMGVTKCQVWRYLNKGRGEFKRVQKATTTTR